MRAPHVATGDYELPRVHLDRVTWPITLDGDGVAHARRPIRQHETPDERSGSQLDLLRRAQRAPREVGRVLRADRTDRRACVVATAWRPSAVRHRVLRGGLAPHGYAGLLHPVLEQTEIVSEWKRWHRKGLGSRIHSARTLLAGDAEDLLGLLILAL